MNAIAVGTWFSIFGVVAEGNRLRAVAERYEKLRDGSRHLYQRRLALSWPGTNAGLRDAQSWLSEVNRRASERLARRSAA